MAQPRLLAFLLVLTFVPAVRGEDAAALWTHGVQRLLDVHCVKCHGPLEQKSGLELDTPEAIRKGGDEGAVIVPGEPDKSRLFAYLAPESDPHMPPKKQLSDAERGMIREWIAAMPVAPASDAKPPTLVQRQFESVTAAIDTLLSESWVARGITPVASVGDRTWVRRVHLDLAGRIPTRAETEAFLSSQDLAKRPALVDQLLSSEDYVIHMRELWDVFLMGRTKRDNQETRRRDKGWWAFLEDAFRTNRPWNETVRELLLARPQSPETHGASWFLYERRNDHQAIAEAVSPLVYGTKINCAQCHDHPLAREIKQAHYWGLVAAFNRSKNVEGTSDVGESAVGGVVNFTNLKKESQPARITLLDGRTLDDSQADSKEEDCDDNYLDPTAKVRVPRHSRREVFADAVTHDNPLLARAFVNRMWAVLLGRGIVHPPDEMNARNVPSHPELIQYLATDFASHQHDVRRLLRGIVLSRVYELGYSDAPPESFARALERPLTAEQIARSWRVALGDSPDDDPLRRAVIGAFPDVLPAEYTATFQQAQFLANSPVLDALLKPSPGNTTSRLEQIPDPATRIQEAFLAVYGREPEPKEAAEVKEFLEAHSDSPGQGARDLLWALLNSAEFLLTP